MCKDVRMDKDVAGYQVSMYQGLEVGWRDSDDSIDVGEYVDERWVWRVLGSM